MAKRVSPDGEVFEDLQVHDPFELPRAPGLYDRVAVSNATAYVETMPSLTEQSDEASANINRMIERLGIDQVAADGYSGPFLADFTEAPGSFQEALQRLDQAKSAFAVLPARVRARFKHDPGELLQFLDRDDEEAFDEAIGLGLIKARPSKGSVAAQAGSEAAPSTTPKGGEKAADSGSKAAGGAA